MENRGGVWIVRLAEKKREREGDEERRRRKLESEGGFETPIYALLLSSHFFEAESCRRKEDDLCKNQRCVDIYMIVLHERESERSDMKSRCKQEEK